MENPPAGQACGARLWRRTLLPYPQACRRFESGLNIGALHFKLRYPLEHFKKDGFGGVAEGFAGMVAEEYLRSLDRSLPVGFGVDHGSEFLGETMLQGALAWILSLLGYQCIYLLASQFGKNLDIFLGIAIADVEPD